MICQHHNEDPCPTCAGFDAYIPKPYGVALREDVEHHGAWWWYQYSKFWMNKYLDENKKVCEMQETKGDRP